MSRILKRSKLSPEKLDPAEAGPRAAIHSEASTEALAAHPGAELAKGDAAKKLIQDGAKRESE